MKDLIFTGMFSVGFELKKQDFSPNPNRKKKHLAVFPRITCGESHARRM